MRQKQIIPQKQAHKKSHCFLFSKPLQKKLTFQSILEVPHSVDQTYLELAYFLHYEVKTLQEQTFGNFTTLYYSRQSTLSTKGLSAAASTGILQLQ